MAACFLWPVLGITAVLAAVWAVAALLGGTGAPSARALDPTVAGSLSAIWGIAALVLAFLLASARAASWRLAAAPGLLLLGKVGGAHHAVTALLSDLAFAGTLPLKTIVAGLLGALALGPLCPASRRDGRCGTLVACLGFGLAAWLLDLAQTGRMLAHPLWARAEEWCELAMTSLLTAACLAAVHDRRALGRSRVRSVRLHLMNSTSEKS